MELKLSESQHQRLIKAREDVRVAELNLLSEINSVKAELERDCLNGFSIGDKVEVQIEYNNVSELGYIVGIYVSTSISTPFARAVFNKPKKDGTMSHHRLYRVDKILSNKTRTK